MQRNVLDFGFRKVIYMSSAWAVVKTTSGGTIGLSRPLTPGLQQTSLSVCSVFSCLELVFCFMDYCVSHTLQCVSTGKQS